jgi:hypothetical protein
VRLNGVVSRVSKSFWIFAKQILSRQEQLLAIMTPSIQNLQFSDGILWRDSRPRIKLDLLASMSFTDEVESTLLSGFDSTDGRPNGINED